jgi:hypothetical protein
MEVLRRSSVFAAEIMDAFDRSPTDKELVAQAKALGREYVHARLLRAGLAWSAPERAAPAPGGRLAEVCAVLLRLGERVGGKGPWLARPLSPPLPGGSACPSLTRPSCHRASPLRRWASPSLGAEGAGSGAPVCLEWPGHRTGQPGLCSPVPPSQAYLHAGSHGRPPTPSSRAQGKLDFRHPGHKL